MSNYKKFIFIFWKLWYKIRFVLVQWSKKYSLNYFAIFVFYKVKNIEMIEFILNLKVRNECLFQFGTINFILADSYVSKWRHHFIKMRQIIIFDFFVDVGREKGLHIIVHFYLPYYGSLLPTSIVTSPNQL